MKKGRPDDKLLLLRAADGELIALSTTCTHRGCDVRWNSERGLIVCPCHGSSCDPATGDVVNGPARSALAPVSVTVSDGSVVRS